MLQKTLWLFSHPRKFRVFKEFLCQKLYKNQAYFLLYLTVSHSSEKKKKTHFRSEDGLESLVALFKFVLQVK